MRTDMGFFDRLFGKKVTVELPQPDGSVRKVKVTARWLEEMERLGEARPVDGQSVKVHILAPQGYRVEEWTIGKEISDEEYRDFRDPGTRNLYVLLFYEAGTPSIRLTQRAIWNQARAAIGDA